ncbi:MAG: SMC-Scp complex subunit ScpB [Methylobacteriaceae bacterium]|nr:SMC-Scp complex subunit ScpB [Methylobacteriaceae bacterium]
MADAARAFEFVEDEDRALEEARAALLAESKRIVEALLFASAEPLEESLLGERLSDGADLAMTLAALREDYATRGVNLARAGTKWYFRTAEDLGWLLRREETPQKKLTRAAVETLAIVAYHQPVTRAEIEDIRGVAISKGTIDVLLETGWIRLRGRRKAPGRPITYGTTDRFLVHFGLEQISDLPGLEELRGAGLFDGRLPAGFGIPKPDDGEALTADEDPLDADDTAEDFPLLAQVDAEDEAAAAADVVASHADDAEAREAGDGEERGREPDDEAAE